jgi:hypothetical protein
LVGGLKEDGGERIEHGPREAWYKEPEDHLGGDAGLRWYAPKLPSR